MSTVKHVLLQDR